MKQTQKNSDAEELNEALIDLYDTLMNDFEPDLISDMIPELDEIYKDETPEERKARMERYAEAFEMFLVAFEDLVGGWHRSFLDIKKAITKDLAVKAGVKEEDILAKLEKKIDTHTDSDHESA